MMQKSWTINEKAINANSLQCKSSFDKLSPEIKKPSVSAEGRESKISGSGTANSKKDSHYDPILSFAPNLNKQKGVIMSKIPYFFETPIPKYFREAGWFKNENTWKFVVWAFSKCSSQEHVEIFDNNEILLAPYEFICGRKKSSSECFMSEKQFRGQLNLMINNRLIKKGANSRANRFSTYIWSTECFSVYKGQVQGQMRANSGPTQGPQTRYNTEYSDVVVVREKKIQEDGVVKNEDLTKDDIYRVNISRYLGWEPQEIDEAWKIIEPIRTQISDIVAYMRGIIEKKRNLKKNEETKCQKKFRMPTKERCQIRKIKERYPTKNNDSKDKPLNKSCVISNGL